MASTTTLALRKLIQTKLNPDDDGSSIEDTASSYEDDLRNPLKRRLASWLMPNESRRGSTASAVQVRNSSEWLHSSTPPTHQTGSMPSIVSLHHTPPHASLSSDGADPRMEYLELDRAAANDGALPTMPAQVPSTWFGTQQGDDLDGVDRQQDASLDNPAPLTSTNTRRQLVRMPSFSSTFSSSSLDSDYHHQHSQPHESTNDRDLLDNKDGIGFKEDAQHSQNQPDMSMTFLYTPSPSPLPITSDMLFMSAVGDQTPNMNSKKNAKDWSDGARQLMLETEQAFASDSAFDSTSFELRLPDLLQFKVEQPAEQDVDTAIPVEEEQKEAQQDDNHAEETTEDTRRSSSSTRPGTAMDTREEVKEPEPITSVAPSKAPTSMLAPSMLVPSVPPPSMLAPSMLARAPSPVTETPPTILPSTVQNNSSNAPASPPARSIWRPENTSTAARRSTEQQDEMDTRRARQYENMLQSDKRKSRSVPPPLPPRNDLLAPTAQDTVPPATPSPKSNSFNVTPLVKSSPSSKAVPKQQPQLSAQARFQSKFEHGGRRPSRMAHWKFGNSSVAEIFTGHRFKKVEADEMLTPQQLAKLKKQREDTRHQAEFESSRAAEYKRMAELERQVEKAENENDNRSRSPSSDCPRDSVPTYICVPEKDSRRLSGRHSLGSDEGDEDEDLMDGLTTIDLLGVSSTRTSSVPSGSPIPVGPLSPPPTAELPCIPRRSVRQSKSARKRRSPTNSLQPEEDDECFYFKSTPFSFTSPTFRHGHISFLKSEMGRGALTMDDTLDWTAFQMAILGAGDMMPDVYDDEEPKFNEDVSQWFDSFGFESHGALIPEEIHSQRSSSHSTLSTAPTEASIPAPVMTGSPNMWQDTMLKDEVYDTSDFFSSHGQSGWAMKGPSLDLIGHPRSNSATCDSTMPIVLCPEDGYEDGLMPIEGSDIGKSPGGEKQSEMGCNMNSDLDDFLKWEAQHAFGPGYYGAH